ncbi:hypothetical protein [Mycoplasma procyoni]|uniref:hypothetical protein n=1 Tax=Mycoplasma procyoni TaxID=568784 RepID=UPI00197B8FF7|nr:hypothetical protein [Mycoplasma procyoni]MBN3534885.1 hypothetical protein [Mycoplasma procyoni]
MNYRIAGFWKRLAADLVTSLLTVVTLGVYSVFNLIAYIQGKPNFAMKAMRLSYSHGSGRMLKLFACRVVWNIFIITIFIDIVMIIMKKGTFPEIWSQNFVIEEME